MDQNKLWNSLKDMGIPDHLIYLLRNLYAGQEARVRTGHGKTDRFPIEEQDSPPRCSMWAMIMDQEAEASD